MIRFEDAVGGQRLHGLEAAAAGDHGIALGADLSPRLGGRGRLPRSGILSRAVRADDEVPQQPEGGDGGLELGVGLGIGRRPALVFGGERELAQRDFPDQRFGPGGDAVHADFPRYGVEIDGTGAAGTTLSSHPRARPGPGRLRLRAGYWRDMGGDGGTAAGVGRPGGGVAGIRFGRRSRRCQGSDGVGAVAGDPPIVAGDVQWPGLAGDRTGG